MPKVSNPFYVFRHKGTYESNHLTLAQNSWRTVFESPTNHKLLYYWAIMQDNTPANPHNIGVRATYDGVVHGSPNTLLNDSQVYYVERNGADNNILFNATQYLFVRFQALECTDVKLEVRTTDVPSAGMALHSWVCYSESVPI
jgi:hypothetical protein